LFEDIIHLFKGTVHPQKIFLKYVILRTVTKNSIIIITKYTWYHRYREVIQNTGAPLLRLHRKPDSKAVIRKLKCSDITWGLSRLTWIVFLLNVNIWAMLNHHIIVRFLLVQTDIVEEGWANSVLQYITL
jgi:hypothetical protein